jgi:hypothetical protein
VTSEPTQSQSRLAIVHAVFYAAGLLFLVAGVFARVPWLLLVSGPCLVMSGALIWVGNQASLRGPVGAVLRKVLGPSRVASMHMRAAFWVLVGVLVALWGVLGAPSGKQEPHAPGDPTFSHPALGVEWRSNPHA